jgi:hypothetical protein
MQTYIIVGYIFITLCCLIELITNQKEDRMLVKMIGALIWPMIWIAGINRLLRP